MCAEVEAEVNRLIEQATNDVGKDASPLEVWAVVQTLLKPSTPFEVHRSCYQKVYETVVDVKPTWIPTKASIEETNIHKMMKKKGFTTYQEFYDWSTNMDTRDAFWKESSENVGIVWEKEPTASFDLSQGGPAHVSYFPGGSLNISDSCFNKRQPSDVALVYAGESAPRQLQNVTFGEVNALSNQIANGITSKLSLGAGDAVAICMPMTPETISIYLGIVKAGCAVISIADSFSAEEIATRCRLGKAKAIVTQDVIYRGAKFLPLYSRVVEANSLMKNGESSENSDIMKIVVVPGTLHSGSYEDRKEQPAVHESVLASMRPELDFSWFDFLNGCSEEFVSVKRSSMDACNILFSSGTTGEPKAIVWSHSTPIKCAVDGYYHQDIRIGERVIWPTNIGWMMGPWLLFQLINGATIGLFQGVPGTKAICEFIDEAKISMVGIVPTIVKAWQASNAASECDWSHVRRFSSTGEASDPVTYHWLVSRVPGYAPVIEYCGGTEIGGSFLSSTVVQPNVPSMFATPVLGSQIMILNEEGKVADDSGEFKEGTDVAISGEIALVPPTIGLSTVLLNRDHFDTYYKDMNTGPNGEILRRHGDEIQLKRSSQHLSNSTCTPYYRALGRCDDTMNIGGIKVGSVEIERVCNLVENVQETAAIAVSAGPDGGPSQLVLYVVLEDSSKEADVAVLKTAMQTSIKTKLNPLFRITDVVITDKLPRTASNKVMRRLLRDEYVKSKAAASS